MKPGFRMFHFVIAFVLVVLHCASAGATPVKIRVKDAHDEMGIAGADKILVVVNSLEFGGKADLLRELSAPDGSLPPLDLAPGAYEAIATCPYGNWSTQVKDFQVADKPVMVEFSLEYALVDAVNINRIHLSVQVLDRQGHPVANAWVIGRGPETRCLDVKKSDERGRATVDIPSDRAEVTVLHNGESYVQTMNIETDIVDCENNCILRETGKLNQTPRRVTVRLP